MQKTDMRYLGKDYKLLKLWVFNGFAATTWLALQALQCFATIGIRYILSNATEEVAASTLGTLGSTFLNLMYKISLLVLAVGILMVWMLGNIYLLRKELYTLAEWVFRWDDL